MQLLLTSVAAFLTISSWPLWIWMLQKKPLKSLRRTHPVSLKWGQVKTWNRSKDKLPSQQVSRISRLSRREFLDAVPDKGWWDIGHHLLQAGPGFLLHLTDSFLLLAWLAGCSVLICGNLLNSTLHSAIYRHHNRKTVAYKEHRSHWNTAFGVQKHAHTMLGWTSTAHANRCLMWHWLLPAFVEHVVHYVSGEHVLVDISLHDKQHITQPARQPAPLSASAHMDTKMHQCTNRTAWRTQDQTCCWHGYTQICRYSFLQTHPVQQIKGKQKHFRVTSHEPELSLELLTMITMKEP